MSAHPADEKARDALARCAIEAGLDVVGGRIRRTSSRFCLGVEHGDYNGTELFGVGTDRFIWIAYKANDSGRVRLFSANFADDGVVEFTPGQGPAPMDPSVASSWARFPLGVDWVLRRGGGRPTGQGMDAVVFGDIPGGGMSRSASLTINLILTTFEVNGTPDDDPWAVVDLAQAVENDYIGSPCGALDQIMILFARAGQGTHYRPASRTVEHVPLGRDAPDFRLVSLDTGTVRPGLENSTYRVRRAECTQLVALAREIVPIDCLADVRSEDVFVQIEAALAGTHPALFDRLRYVYAAQQRFPRMLQAWREGDVAALGRVFREDGIGLRDLYQISGPELETMCDLARTVPGVFGERMLGGGDQGASGAIVATDAVASLRHAVDMGYPRSHPDYADRYAVHTCGIVDGVTELEGL